MDWSAAADAFIKVWRETGALQYGAAGILVCMLFALAWKFLDAWGRRKGKSNDD